MFRVAGDGPAGRAVGAAQGGARRRGHARRSERKAGLTEADGLRVWVLINEVPDGNWGAAGNVVQFAQLRAAAAAEREEAGKAAAVVGASS